MERKKLAVILLLFFSLALLLSNVGAIVGVTPTPTNSSWFQNATGVNITGGYVYFSSFDVSEQTYRWAGFWGNVTGKIVLKDSAGNDLMLNHWNIDNVKDGSVIYATTYDKVLDPSLFSSTNESILKRADTLYGYNYTVTDSIYNTFKDGASLFQSPSMDTPIPVNSTTLSGIWTNYIIRRTNSWPSTTADFVFAVEVKNNQQGFNNQIMDYELLIPENEEAGDGEGIPTTYYFWVELR